MFISHLFLLPALFLMFHTPAPLPPLNSDGRECIFSWSWFYGNIHLVPVHHGLFPLIFVPWLPCSVLLQGHDSCVCMSQCSRVTWCPSGFSQLRGPGKDWWTEGREKGRASIISSTGNNCSCCCLSFMVLALLDSCLLIPASVGKIGPLNSGNIFPFMFLQLGCLCPSKRDHCPIDPLFYFFCGTWAFLIMVHGLSCPLAYGILVSLTKSWACTPSIRGWSLTAGPPGKSLDPLF